MDNNLTIVMYHYVRQLEVTRYPKIKGLRTSDFRDQINYLRRNYTPVTVAEVVHCVRTGDALPRNAVLLTFDDGYLEHYTTVFPILFDVNIQGAFFPPVGPVVRSELLDVNRVHFLLATANAETLGVEIDKAVQECKAAYGLESLETYRSKWAQANRFDDAETIYVKRMLQVALPKELRNDLARKLFARYVTVDEAAFASEIYATADQLKLMQANGMYIGSHGDSHCWLNSLDEASQRQEIEKSLDFLRYINSPVGNYWVMCYPYGAWNEGLLTLLQEFNCALGLTTEVATARLGVHNPLLLPRYDTNDIPLR